jgi:hypothetical protein
LPCGYEWRYPKNNFHGNKTMAFVFHPPEHSFVFFCRR